MRAPSPTLSGQRQYYVDNLRNLAVLALILFHTARLFDSEAWHMKNAATYPAADYLIGFFNPWHMPLLFFLAGMSAVLALRKRSATAFVGERISRLLVPFIAGVVLAVLPQVYLERISPYVPGRSSPIDFHGSSFAFIPRFFQMVPYPEGDFSWHHLWFLLYLFLYSLLLAPILVWIARSAVATRIGDWFASGFKPALLLIPLLAAELVLRPSFPATHGLINDWADHANFIAIVLIGALAAGSPTLVASFVRLRFVALMLAIAASVFCVIGRQWAQQAFGEASWTIVPAMRAADEWLWIVAFVAFGRGLLDRRVAYLTAFSRYALPFYIFHQAIIIYLGWLTFGWSGMPLVKYATIGVLALVISYGLARLFDLTAVTRFIIGLKTPPRGPTVAGAPIAHPA